MVNWAENPDGAVYQRAIAATADDTYAADRWNVLTQTGTVMPSQIANPEDGYRFGLRLTQSQAAAQRMGDSHIMDGRSTAQLRGKVVTCGGRYRLSVAGNLRCAILAWTGTEDAVTSDVVNNWTSGVYSAGNFFLAANLTVVATNSTALAAATTQTVGVSGTVPSNANNLIHLFWTEAAVAQNVTLDRWAQRIVEASTLVDYIKRSIGLETALCKRYARAYAGVPIGTASTSQRTSSDGALPLGDGMRALPSLAPGASYAASAGAAGTPGILGGDTNMLVMYSSTASWTTGATINFTGLLTADL